MLEKRKDLMKIRFRQKIQAVIDGKAETFLYKTKPSAMPVFAKYNERTQYRRLKRDIFKNLVLKEFDEE